VPHKCPNLSTYIKACSNSPWDGLRLAALKHCNVNSHMLLVTDFYHHHLWTRAATKSFHLLLVFLHLCLSCSEGSYLLKVFAIVTFWDHTLAFNVISKLSIWGSKVHLQFHLVFLLPRTLIHSDALACYLSLVWTFSFLTSGPTLSWDFTRFRHGVRYCLTSVGCYNKLL
jgi:hypothetical protein